MFSTYIQKKAFRQMNKALCSSHQAGRFALILLDLASEAMSWMASAAFVPSRASSKTAATSAQFQGRCSWQIEKSHEITHHTTGMSIRAERMSN